MGNRWVLLMCVCVSLALKTSGVVVVNLGRCAPILATDNDVVEFGANLAFLQGEFFLHGALGTGIDAINPTLAGGGPPPVGARIANLDPLARGIIEELGYQEMSLLKIAFEKTGGGIVRPLLNLSREAFADFFDRAAGTRLTPPFNPYANTLNYLLAAVLFPYVGFTTLVGATPRLVSLQSRMVLASVIGLEAGQDAVLRTLLYQSANQTVPPYNITVARFTNLTSSLYNQLGNCGLKNEGLIVPRSLGAENRTESNILAADSRSLTYAITPQEALRQLYVTGDEKKPSGFYPKGANGRIARSFLLRG